MRLLMQLARYQLYTALRGIRHYTRLSSNTKLNRMEVKVVPALQDNFMYILIDTNSKQTAVIDPVEPHKLMGIIENEQLILTTVLTTHHHFDHSGGNEAIVGLRPKLSVYGGDDRIPKLSHKVSHGQEINIGTANTSVVNSNLIG